MKNCYQIQLPSGDFIELECSHFQLKKKIAEQVPNIPYDFILILDKQNSPFDLNKFLAETQLIKGKAVIHYRVFDLSKLIIEWFQRSLYIYNYKLKEVETATIISKLEKELSELKATKNEMALENQSKSSQYDNLEQQTKKQIASLEHQLQESQKKLNLQNLMASEKQKNFEQEKIKLENAYKDLQESQQQSKAETNQKITQLLEENKNIVQQSQQNLEQVQAQWQQYIQQMSIQMYNQYNNQFSEKEVEFQHQIKDLQEKHKQEMNLKNNQAKQKEDENEVIIAELKKDLGKEKSQVQILKKQNDGLLKNINDLEQEKNAIEARCNQRSSNLQMELNQKNKNDQQKIAYERDSLLSELQEQQALVIQQAANIKTYQAVITSLEDEIKIKEENVKQFFQMQLDEQLNINKQLNNKLKEKDLTISQLNDQLTSLNYEIDKKNEDGNYFQQQKSGFDSNQQDYKTCSNYSINNNISHQVNQSRQIQQQEGKQGGHATKYQETEKMPNQQLIKSNNELAGELKISQNFQFNKTDQSAHYEAKIQSQIQNFRQPKQFEQLPQSNMILKAHPKVVQSSINFKDDEKQQFRQPADKSDALQQTASKSAQEY